MSVSHPEAVRPAQAAGATDMAGLLGLREIAAAVAAQAISVERVDVADYAAWGAAFAALSAGAALPNPFMSPAALGAARTFADDEDLVILAARHAEAPGAPLVGLWAMRRIRDIWSCGIEVLQAPCVPKFDCLASPVLDAAMSRKALAALLAHIVAAPDLPRLIRASSWPAAMGADLPPDVAIHHAERWSRALLAPQDATDAESGLKAAMGSAYKKRKAQERALARAGTLRHDSLRRDAALAALDDFVALERRGWKGRAGTALADVQADAAYMHAALRGFARADQLCVDVLRLDDAPVAMGIVVEAGPASIFWKAAFDEAHARHSPGVLLDMAVTRRLFAEGRPMLDSGMMEFTDPATQVWAGRSDMTQAVIDLGAGGQGVLVRLGHQARYRLRLLQRRFKG